MTMPRRRSSLHVLLILLIPFWLAAALAGCAPTEESADVDREELRGILLEYLPKVAEAYATGNLEPVEPYVSPREVAVLRKNVRELAQQGRTVKTELEELTIESVDVVSYGSVFVTTVEEWSVQVYAQGTDNLLAEDPSQINRVRYQLRREDGEWTIMARNSETLQD